METVLQEIHLIADCWVGIFSQRLQCSLKQNKKHGTAEAYSNSNNRHTEKLGTETTIITNNL